MKQTKSHSLVLKLQYKRLVRNNWNLKLPIAKAKENQELVPLASSQTLRFIDEIIGGEDHENEIRGFKKEIEVLKLLDNSDENKKKIKELYSKKENLQFNKDYVVIVFDSKKEFDECKSKYKNDELRINGKKFYRLLGTAAGVKKQNIIYVSEDVCVELKKKLHNDRNIVNKLIPAKLEAYLALSCSASVEVSSPKNIIVVNDCETTFTENVITIKDNGENEPILEEVDGYEIHLCDSDGYGLISPRLAEQWAIDIEEGKFIPTGFCIRFSFTKGMVFTFDYEDFAEKINGRNYIVKDAWGVERDVREADLILTTSMLKLWDSYDSCEDFLEKSYNNGWKWAVTKMCPKELEHERTFNYQFLQSFELSDEDVQELIKPTVDSIKDSLGEDYVKSLLFLRGTKVTSNNLFKGQNDYVKALMIEEGMLKDPYVIDRMYSMRQKRIKDAKIGVLDMHSNYAIVSGDPYALCQSMFGLEVTGILEAGEIYSDYWLNDGANEILLFRAPMTCHNNIRKAKVSNKEDAKYWYRYMKTCVVLNCWDTICDALNGMD